MTPLVSFREAASDPQLLGPILGAKSWLTWRVLLIAAMGEALTNDEREIFRKITGRDHEPLQRVEELLAVVGRRGGKTRATAAQCIYASCLCDWSDKLVPGEKGVALILSPDLRQSAGMLGYIRAALEQSPILSQMVVNDVSDTITLHNGITIETRSSNPNRIRGASGIFVAFEEVCFHPPDESGSSLSDTNLYTAARPMLATTGGMISSITSPHRRKGETWETFKSNYGPQGDPAILVATGASRDFNPTLPQKVVDRALKRDPAAARAEFLGLWRDDLEDYVKLESLLACVVEGRERIPPSPLCQYIGYVDPSGGSVDSMCLCIAHLERDKAVIDLLHEITAPFNPTSAAREIAALCKSYDVYTVHGDSYGAGWVSDNFRSLGITYEKAERSTSEQFLEFLPQINSGKVALLDHPRAIAQLAALERRSSRTGRASVGHPAGGHDDLATVLAGATNLVMGNASGFDYRRLLFGLSE